MQALKNIEAALNKLGATSIGKEIAGIASDIIGEAALIMLAALVGMMMLTIDLNDQLYCDATEIDGVRRDWVFATKLLISTTTIAQHMPNVLHKLVRAASLIASKRNRLCISLRSSVHAAPPILVRG